jgi:hypothetical protein
VALSQTESTGLNDRCTEPPRDFLFAVTWSTLMSSLEPIHAADPNFANAVEPIETPGQVPSFVPAVVSVEREAAANWRAEPESKGRWEMVVPKMDRTAARSSLPPRTVPSPRTAPRFLFAHQHEDRTSVPQKPWLSRTLAAVSGRTRSLLAVESENLQPLRMSPPKSISSSDQLTKGEPIKDKRTERELVLARIARAVRSRSKSGDLALTIHRHGKEAGIS